MTDHDNAVTVDEDGGGCRGLDPRRDLCDFGSTWFAWGDAARGSAQLALALAADATGDDDRALAVSRRLESRLVASLPAEGWVLTKRQVLAAIREVERERVAPAEVHEPVPPTWEPAATPLARRIDRHLEALAE